VLAFFSGGIGTENIRILILEDLTMNLIATILLMLAANNDSPEAKIKEVLLQGEKERQAWVTDLKTGLKESAKHSPKSSTGGNVRYYKDAIKRLDSMRGEFLPTVSLDVGSVGRFRKWRGDHDTIDDLERLLPLRVLQVVDENNALVEWSKRGDRDTTVIWLKGFSTKNIADGKVLTISSPVKVTGTKRYTTPLGASNTVMLIEPFEVSKELLTKAAEELGLINKTKKRSATKPPPISKNRE
jgi:hypothetical protein